MHLMAFYSPTYTAILRGQVFLAIVILAMVAVGGTHHSQGICTIPLLNACWSYAAKAHP